MVGCVENERNNDRDVLKRGSFIEKCENGKYCGITG
jgi:hypothetical protein